MLRRIPVTIGHHLPKHPNALSPSPMTGSFVRWSDDTTPRTDRPRKFQFRQWREDVGQRVVRRSESRVIA